MPTARPPREAGARSESCSESPCRRASVKVRVGACSRTSRPGTCRIVSTESWGPANWSTSFRVLSHEPWVVECTLTVCGACRADVGYSNAPDSEDETEPAKAAYSDALKRAAVGFGVGRWLYDS